MRVYKVVALSDHGWVCLGLKFNNKVSCVFEVNFVAQSRVPNLSSILHSRLHEDVHLHSLLLRLRFSKARRCVNDSTVCYALG